MIHENVNLLVSKLHSLGALKSTESCVTSLLGSVVCDIGRKSCMFEECEVCKTNGISLSESVDLTVSCTWEIWASVREDRMINNKQVEASSTNKENHKVRVYRRLGGCNKPGFHKVQETPFHHAVSTLLLSPASRA